MSRVEKTEAGTLISAASASSDTRLLVAVSGSPRSEALIRAAGQLAQVLGATWEAIHIETPEADRDSERGRTAVQALALASRLGAMIITLPAATAVDGIQAHIDDTPARHLVLGTSRRRGWRGKSLLDTLAARNDGVVLHLYPAASEQPPTEGHRSKTALAVPLASYGYAAALVAATLLISEGLQRFLGSRPLDLLFLFPVIAVAARLGLKPALLAVALSVVCYNYFLLTPAWSFNPAAPQNLVMTAVLIAVAAYTALITTRMRGRLLLSDRSARENASVAALAQKLTRDADWETTAMTVCEHVHHLLKVQAAVYREQDGKLTVAAAMPNHVTLGPVDAAALDWAWAQGEPTGAGTETLSAADWQFQPLKTSLGTLAVLALAREDGRDPVRVDQRLMLQTLVAQSALAHERLRLEDRMRETALRA